MERKSDEYLKLALDAVDSDIQSLMDRKQRILEMISSSEAATGSGSSRDSILNYIIQNDKANASSIVKALGIPRSTVGLVLRQLSEKNLISKSGVAAGTRYSATRNGIKATQPEE